MYKSRSRDHKLGSSSRIHIIRFVIFAIYINDTPQALSISHTYLYGDGTSFLYQHKDITEIENVLNKEFANVCKWFVDKNLSIHFGEDKTKCILFSKEIWRLRIADNNNRIIQFLIVKYPGSCLDANLSISWYPLVRQDIRKTYRLVEINASVFA